MSLALQIFMGTIVLTTCALIHVGTFAIAIPFFERVGRKTSQMHAMSRNALLMCLGVGTTVAAHTVQIWLWAWVLYLFDAFDGFATCFYFALVTYTSLGYGDLVLGEGARVFGAFAAVTGLLTFGISTALLLGLVLRLLRLLGDGRR